MYQVTYPATAEQVALGVAFEGEIAHMEFETLEGAESFASGKHDATIEPLDCLL